MANKIYRAVETPLVFRDSGGDVVLTLQNLAAGAGRVSAQYDRGDGSKPQYHEVTAVFQMETAGVTEKLDDFRSSVLKRRWLKRRH